MVSLPRLEESTNFQDPSNPLLSLLLHKMSDPAVILKDTLESCIMLLVCVRVVTMASALLVIG
jgi:hypothetical protein